MCDTREILLESHRVHPGTCTSALSPGISLGGFSKMLPSSCLALSAAFCQSLLPLSLARGKDLDPQSLCVPHRWSESRSREGFASPSPCSELVPAQWVLDTNNSAFGADMSNGRCWQALLGLTGCQHTPRKAKGRESKRRGTHIHCKPKPEPANSYPLPYHLSLLQAHLHSGNTSRPFRSNPCPVFNPSSLLICPRQKVFDSQCSVPGGKVTLHPAVVPLVYLIYRNQANDISADANKTWYVIYMLWKKQKKWF